MQIIGEPREMMVTAVQGGVQESSCDPAADVQTDVGFIQGGAGVTKQSCPVLAEERRMSSFSLRGSNVTRWRIVLGLHDVDEQVAGHV